MTSRTGWILDVAAAIADGAPVDWQALDRQAPTERDRRLLKELRVIARLATARRPAPAAPVPES